MIQYARFENRKEKGVESGDWGSSGTISLVQRRRYDGRREQEKKREPGNQVSPAWQHGSMAAKREQVRTAKW